MLWGKRKDRWKDTTAIYTKSKLNFSGSHTLRFEGMTEGVQRGAEEWWLAAPPLSALHDRRVSRVWPVFTFSRAAVQLGRPSTTPAGFDIIQARRLRCSLVSTALEGGSHWCEMRFIVGLIRKRSQHPVCLVGWCEYHVD